jgi:hypothetical protein
MRIQILPLPSVIVGDNVEEPFALIVDQWPDGAYDSSLQGFADACGAKAVWVRAETVEVVDRHAETQPTPTATINATLYGKPVHIEWPDGLPLGLSRREVGERLGRALLEPAHIAASKTPHPYMDAGEGWCSTCGLGRLARIHRV